MKKVDFYLRGTSLQVPKKVDVCQTRVFKSRYLKKSTFLSRLTALIYYTLLVVVVKDSVAVEIIFMPCKNYTI